VDDELQILLKVTAIVDGVSAATISAEHVSVDEPIPASMFDFSPPAGTRIAHVGAKTTSGQSRASNGMTRGRS
jgi:hypothetical protein